MAVATLVDLLRIQPYVFASNRLRDVVGGSALVGHATDPHLLKSQATGGQVVFAAGGAALLRFQDPGRETEFAARYSRHLLDNMPGLEVEIVHAGASKIGWRGAVLEAQKKLERAKLAHAPQAPVLGQSVTAECAETRLVAGRRLREQGGGHRPLAVSVAARRGPRDDSRWTALLPRTHFQGWPLAFPHALDKLGRSAGEMSLLGVVHVDGNRVGRRQQEWLRGLPQHLSDEEVIEQQGALSRQIDGVTAEALRHVLDRVCASLRRAEGGDGFEAFSQPLQRGFRLAEGDRSRILYLPIRPVLRGGDDLTFVCDARLALDLARTALEAFRDRPIPELGSPLGACAGVAIVRAHAPFSRAYELAEDLCASAKRKLVALGRPDGYALDWHIGLRAPLETLERLRARQYRRDGRSLTGRPYELGAGAQAFSFAWLDEVVLGGTAGRSPQGGFQNEFWQGRRNKIKELRELGREGAAAVQAALETWKVTAGVASLPASLQTRGHQGLAALLDAIELVDLHHPLRETGGDGHGAGTEGAAGE